MVLASASSELVFVGRTRSFVAKRGMLVDRMKRQALLLLLLLFLRHVLELTRQCSFNFLQSGTVNNAGIFLIAACNANGVGSLRLMRQRLGG